MQLIEVAKKSRGFFACYVLPAFLLGWQLFSDWWIWTTTANTRIFSWKPIGDKELGILLHKCGGRNLYWCGCADWGQHRDGTHCKLSQWIRLRENSHCHRDWAFHPHYHWCSCFPWSHLFGSVIDSWLRLVDFCALSHWHHCGKCAWRTSCYCYGNLTSY